MGNKQGKDPSHSNEAPPRVPPKAPSVPQGKQSVAQTKVNGMRKRNLLK